MELQHLNLKIFVADPAAVDLTAFIGIFHHWIQQRGLPEMLVDVADYRHVPRGPGVLLIGHEAAYSLDNTEDRPGLLYNCKARLDGSTQDKLQQAARALLLAARRLEEEEGLIFNGGELQLLVNDRLLAPNTPETLAALRPDLEAFFALLYGEGGFELEAGAADPRARFTVTARAATQPSVVDLLERLPEPEVAHA